MTTTYDFSRCDDCGHPLEPEARLYGLCAQCEGAVPPSTDDEHES